MKSSTHRRWIVPALLAAVLAVGCKGTTPAEPPVEPEPPPPTTAESLMTGAWQFTATNTYTNWEGMEVTITETSTLTFTPSRWLVHTDWEDTTAGEGDYVRSGGWTVTGDDTIEWDRWIWADDGREQELSTKHFFWDDEERTVLYLNTWHHGENTSFYHRWTKTEASPVDPTGTWHDVNYRVYDDGDGPYDVRQELQLEIADGAFKYTQRMIAPQNDSFTPSEWVTTGTLEIDEEERFLWVTVTLRTLNGQELDDDPLPGLLTRWAYYIQETRNDGTELYLSTFAIEMLFDYEAQTWTVGDPEFPYGDYWVEMNVGPVDASVSEAAHPDPPLYGGFRLDN